MTADNFAMQKYKQGFIVNPLVMSPQQPVASVIDAKKQFGFSGIPVTETGEMGGRLVGLITQRDIDFLTADEHNRLISEVTITPALHYCFSLGSMIRIVTHYISWLLMTFGHI
jgi:CBS domain-containing protein